RAAALVGARLRRGDRRQPGRESLPRKRPHPPARRARLPRPRQSPAGDGGPRRAARAYLRSRGLAMGRALDRLAGLPALFGYGRLTLRRSLATPTWRASGLGPAPVQSPVARAVAAETFPRLTLRRSLATPTWRRPGLARRPSNPRWQEQLRLRP